MVRKQPVSVRTRLRTCSLRTTPRQCETYAPLRGGNSLGRLRVNERCDTDIAQDLSRKFRPTVLTQVLTARVNHAVAPLKRQALGFLATLVEAQQWVQVRQGSPLAYCSIAGSKRTQRRNVFLWGRSRRGRP
jgi:hypothetical protein